MSNVFVLPKQVPLNSAGRVYPGAKAFFYRTNTNTAKAVYSDADHNTPYVQPVEASVGGTFPVVYLDTSDEEYRVTLKTAADALIYTVDDIGGRLDQDEFDEFLSAVTAAELGAIIFPRTAGEIAASVTPTNYARPPGDFVRYGLSTAASGTTNAAAVNAALSSNSYCFCYDAGTYSISNTMNAHSNQSVFLSAGVVLQATVKNWSGLGFFRIDSISNFQLQGGVFDGNKAANPGGLLIGILILASDNVICIGVTAKNCPSDNTTLGAQGDGFYMGNTGSTICTNVQLIGCNSLDNVRQGLSVVQADGWAVIGGSYSGTTGNNPGGGIDVEADPGVGDVRNGRIIGVEMADNYSALILTESSFNIKVIGCDLIGSRSTSLLLSEVTNASLVGNLIQPAVMTVDNPIIDVIASADVVFSENLIEGQGSASTHEGAGVRFPSGSTNISFTRNIVKTTRLQALALGSSALAGAPTLINFSDNTLIDCVDTAGFPTAACIGIGGNTVGSHYPLLVTVRNNTLYDTRGTPAAYGVQLTNIPAATQANYRIDSNRVIGPTVAFNNNVVDVPPLCGVVTWNPGNLVDGAGETSPDITVTGAEIGDAVEVYEPYAIGDCITKGSVKSANTCVIRLQNESGSAAFDGASGSWKVRVRKLTQL